MSGLYAKGREGFLDGTIDWDTDTIKVILVDTALYTVDLVAHDFLDDVPVGARVGSAVTLGGKTVTGGVADANDATFSAVTGASVEALVSYKDVGGLDSTRRLIAYIDGISVTPNGSDITVAWDNGSSKIFKL
jgi:hypothetical protein